MHRSVRSGPNTGFLGVGGSEPLKRSQRPCEAYRFPLDSVTSKPPTHPKSYGPPAQSRVRQNAPHAGDVSGFAPTIPADAHAQSYSLEGPCKDAINAMQKQIDVHFEEINKLRSAQNTYVPVSRLPAEILSEVFLCIVESSLQHGDFGFVAGTFWFRQVCKRWNEVAVGFPQLWVHWVARAVRAWPLFKARSKDAPIFLTWHPYHSSTSGRGILADPAILPRIHQLDFVGDEKESEQFFRALDSSAASKASFIRVHITPHSPRQNNEQGTQEYLARFLSSPFPKLSKLDIENLKPDSSSPVFTTSNLTSLKLSFPYGARPRYTLVQLSRILQKHPYLRELELEDPLTPQVESAEAPVPFALPQLVVLRLHGTPGYLLRLTNLIGTSSPLHNLALNFKYTHGQDITALVDVTKKILSAYYECEGLDHPRNANYLSVAGAQWGPLYFAARSRSTPVSSPRPPLELQFCRTDELMNILPLFPLKDTREFSIGGLVLSSTEHHRMLQLVKGISQLQLSRLDIGPVLEALDPRNRGASKGTTEISR